MITTYRKTLNGNLKKLDEVKNGALLNVENVTKEELNYLAELYELEYADLDDVLDMYELPRIERHNKAIVIYIRTPNETGTDVMMMIMNEKYFTMVSARENMFARKLIGLKGLPPTTQQSKLFGYMMLVLTREYTQKVKKVLDTTSSFRTFERIARKDVIELVYQEELLRQYLASLVPLKNVILPITEGKSIKLHESDKDMFEDLYNSIHQSVDTCRVQVESIQSLRDTQQIVFTNDLNYTMKFLASFTVLLTLPMVISSIYGMNIRLPLADHPFAFILIMGLSVGITLLLLIWFSRNKWFEN
jgi:magnesium transporter